MARFKGWTSKSIENMERAKNEKHVKEKNKGITLSISPDYIYQIQGAVKLLEPNIIIEREYRFYPKRKFRFDAAIIDYKIAIEFEGNIYPVECKNCKGKGCRSCNFSSKSIGRHNRGKGYSKDLEKYNLATLNGWRILRYCTEDLNKKNWEYYAANQIISLYYNIKHKII